YSGTVRLSEDKAFTPVYAKNITLTYDTNGSSESIKEQQAVILRYGTESAKATFTLAAAPVRDGCEFTGWAVSTDPTKVYSAGETVELPINAIATAQWSKIELPPEKLTVTYDYKTNGGTNISATAPFASVEKGEKANLTFESTKDGWEFVGWNTDKDAREALSELTVTEDVTLYAIYKKDITALFYSGENADTVHAGINETLYNNDREVSVTAPLRIAVDGWYFEGWRRDKHAVESEYAAQYPGSTDSIRITFSDNIDFYSVYSRQITITKDTGAPTKSYKQYFNTGGGIESIAYMLSEPAMQYKENEQGETERFAGWEVVTTNDAGEEIVTEQKPGTVVNIDQNTTVRAKYVNVPEGATLPKVETVGSSVISSTQALVIKDVTNDDVTGNDIISQGFVYWSKLGDGTKYTVTSSNDYFALEHLAPSTEYYYYAFAENAAGTSKGYIKSFKTESDGNTPTALTINPEYVSIKKDEKYQLLATLLPVAAENKILWSSSDPSKVTVDENGMLTAVAAGEGIIITATTEIGRLTAECIVDVTEDKTVTEKNFSEWHMASHTYFGAENGFDWDTADADGGNHSIATAYLARWEGAVMEEDDAYPAYTKGTRPSKTADEQYHIQNVEWLPAREKITSEDPLKNDDEIKSALMEYGAVYTLMCIDWDCFDYTSTNYYCPNEINYNGHAITIVGWDDNYSKENFTGAYKPDKNGAFICKNSWGTDVGENGYFYISYYDACMGRLDSNAVVTNAESKTNYNTIYQYDPLGAIGYIGYEDTTYAANVFPENGKSLTKDEDLKAVSFYTYHKNTSYDVYVVTDYKGSASLSKLTTPLASGVIKNSGYHTINLTNAVRLKQGTRFAVVVKLDVPGENSYFYCEYPVYGYSSKARSNADESYFSYNGKNWDDITEYITNGNFCIKAFTDNGFALTSADLFSAVDNESRDYESDKVYTLDEAKEMGMPVNEDYEKFTQNKNGFKLSSLGAASPALGSMPSIIKAGSNSVTYTEGARFPSRYNLAEMGLVSSVKNQGEWGTCWAHAMYASLESCMMRAEMTHSTASGTPQVILSRSTLTMSPEASVTLAKKITPVGTEDKTVVWTSSDETIARVDTNGTIRSINPGSATISATT
ncbi:MAG: Ig-like domain-containing protein, partial [Clostridia bacterium]|nr:Ig-like domain-containing protein [Clostridia bacterium]